MLKLKFSRIATIQNRRDNHIILVIITRYFFFVNSDKLVGIINNDIPSSMEISLAKFALKIRFPSY